MTEVIKQFRESNRKLFEIAKSERSPLPHNGEISVMKQRVLRGGETEFRTGYSFRIDGREYFEPTIEDAEKILHNAGFELKRKDYGFTEYVNKKRQRKYLAVVSKNEEITKAWRRISENAHKLLFQANFRNAMCDLVLCPNREKVATIWTIGKKKGFQFLLL